MNDQIVQLENLTKNYGSTRAVNGLNLSIKKGEIFGLLGPNGAGKTTTILMMMGLVEPTYGTAHICGYNATNNPIAVKRQVGYMPDNIGFYDQMTALENLIYIGELNGIPRTEVKSRAIEVMKTVGLEDAAIHKKTGAYSRGMKQRLGLAEVLIKNPKVVILDEPTLGIDPSGVKEFLNLISSLSREKGLTVLLSSHHLYQVQQVCDRIGIFVKGNLLVEGSINTLSDSLFQKNSFEVQISLQNTLGDSWKDEADLLKLDAVQKVSAEGSTVTIISHCDKTPDIVRFFVQKGYDITGVHKKEYGLEDIYQKYFES
ncbi:hypothetical protein GCM10028791_41650 [Echinicola sediminis]